MENMSVSTVTMLFSLGNIENLLKSSIIKYWLVINLEINFMDLSIHYKIFKEN